MVNAVLNRSSVETAAHRDERPHVRALTSLRFVLAMIVVAVHYDQLLSPGMIYVHRSYGLGTCAVTAFFVLSGFILTYQYFHEKGTPINRREFWRARFARIAPMYWFSLLLALCIVPAADLPSEKNMPLVLLTSGSFSHMWLPIRDLFSGLNGPAYTLSIEFFFYLIFPMMIAPIARNGWLWLIGALAVPVAMLCVTPQSMTDWALYFFPPGRLAEFIIGCVAGVLFLRHRNLRLPFTLAEVLVFGTFFAFIYITAPWHRADHPFMNVLYRTATAATFALMTFVFAYQSGRLSKVLSWAPFVVLGEISYAIYLVHMIFMRTLIHNNIAIPMVNSAGTVLSFTLFVVAVSAICYITIEKPWRRAIVAGQLPRGIAPACGAAIAVGLVCWSLFYYPVREVISGAVDGYSGIAFGDSVELDRIHIWSEPGGIEISSHWHSLTTPSEAEYLAVHILDSNSNIVHQCDRRLLPSTPRSKWENRLLIPKESLSNGIAIGLAVFRDPSKSLPIRSGQALTDWGDHRLILPLPTE